VALQTLRTQIVSAPEEPRDQVRGLTHMRLIRTCAVWRPDETAFRDPVAATRTPSASATTSGQHPGVGFARGAISRAEWSGG
jgi:hypothetical protein